MTSQMGMFFTLPFLQFVSMLLSSISVLPQVLECTNSIDLNTRHGGILATAEVTHALCQHFKNKYLLNYVLCYTCKLLKSLHSYLSYFIYYIMILWFCGLQERTYEPNKVFVVIKNWLFHQGYLVYAIYVFLTSWIVKYLAQN